MQGTTRTGSGLCAHKVDQGSAAATMVCDGGGGSGSGLLWGRRHRWARARVTRTSGRPGLRSLSSGSGCREPGHGKGEAHDCGAWHSRAQSRGGGW